MKKRIILCHFDETCVSHQTAGTWRHPESQAWRYKDLDYWTSLAIECERGCFDAIFIADVVGTYDVYRGSAETALIDADQIPVGDPFASVGAMAAVTKDLCFGVTASVSYEAPYLLARRLSTYDHLTKGRFAWNVVASYLNSAAINMGMDKQIPHDVRYEMADEYMDVMYKLWEGSWEDGAVLRDREKGVFTDPTKVHPINHAGKYYKIPGIHLCEPSPQRTPFIFQAGASSRGRRFAATHGEGVFILAASVEQAREMSDDIRRLAVEEGRSPDSVRIVTLLTVVTGATDDAAHRKYEEYMSYTNPEGMLAFFSGWTNIDFSRLNLNEPLKAVDNDGLRTLLETLSGTRAGKIWTVGEVMKERSIGGTGPTLIGGPKKIADELERWVDDGGIDGFNLPYVVTPGSTSDFIDFVVPELRRRGRVQTSYKPGTFREKFLGTPDYRAGSTHPSAKYRTAYLGKESVADQTRVLEPA